MKSNEFKTHKVICHLQLRTRHDYILTIERKEKQQSLRDTKNLSLLFIFLSCFYLRTFSSNDNKTSFTTITLLLTYSAHNERSIEISFRIIYFFCNRRNSFLNFGGPQPYNSEALPFTYDHYVVIELTDKLYNSVTVCFCVSP